MSRLLPLVWLGACAEPDPSGLFNSVDLAIEADAAVASERFVQAIASASDTLHVALPAGDDVAIADAIVEAVDRGVQVEVVTDVDLAAAPGIAPLIAAEVPVQLADGELTYFEFSLNADVSWPSTDVRMSHAYVVSDQRTILAASTAGTSAPGTRLLFEVEGEEIVEDLLAEHNQMFGGFDATAVNAFDSPAKSIVDSRWRYGTQTEVELQLWFGPQERLVKRVIDAVYSARTSVWILTDELGAEGLADALARKHELGFDVRLVLGPGYGTTTTDALGRVVAEKIAGLPRCDTDQVVVPTVVLVDYQPQDSAFPSRVRAMTMTMPLYSATRLHRGETVVTDQLVDGAMWEFTSAQLPEAGSPLDQLLDVFLDHCPEAF